MSTYFLLALAFALIAAALLQARQLPHVKGKRGERRVSKWLRSYLDQKDYRILDDLMLPSQLGGTTQIDHVVLSRYGVFVIETKNMSGWIFGSAEQSTWTQTLYRFKSGFQNPLRQNYGHAKAVQATLGLKAGQLFNVVVFVGSAVPKTPMPKNVVWSKCEFLQLIENQRDIQFYPAQLDDLEQRLLDASLPSNSQTRRAHIQSTHHRANARKTNDMRCPRCGARLVDRTNRRTGEAFVGCSRFPQCRGTL